MRVAIIGGGASGFFAAIQLKENLPHLIIDIFEKHNQVLSKVKISGGGRCNVTHHCFDPKSLIDAYPRGHKKLLRGFYHFGPLQMIGWLEERGVQLKAEEDGRMFPITNTSKTIIELFVQKAFDLGVKLHTNKGANKIIKQGEYFLVDVEGSVLEYDIVILATGSSKQGYEIASSLGHKITEPVPSLFTFVIEDRGLNDLSGISFEEVEIRLGNSKLKSKGPLLLTHWGISGPAVLKLSSYAAREMKEKNYHEMIQIDLMPNSSLEELTALLFSLKEKHAAKIIGQDGATIGLAGRFWRYFLGDVLAAKMWGKVDKSDLRKIASKLKGWDLEVKGKSTYKEEFVTAGGVDLEEVDLCSFESKIIPNLYFVGEVLDIDAITGGYNFQNAWTSAYLAAKEIAKKNSKLDCMPS